MPVDRWVFWAGVLALVSWFPLEFIFGPAFAPVGTGYDYTPIAVILGTILLLASAYIGGGAKAAQGPAKEAITAAPGPPAR
jgi:hypothetical protein